MYYYRVASVVSILVSLGLLLLWFGPFDPSNAGPFVEKLCYDIQTLSIPVGVLAAVGGVANIIYWIRTRYAFLFNPLLQIFWAVVAPLAIFGYVGLSLYAAGAVNDGKFNWSPWSGYGLATLLALLAVVSFVTIVTGWVVDEED